MLLRNHEPASIEWTEKTSRGYPDEAEDIKAVMACRAIMQKVLAKFNGWEVNYEAMDEIEKAFAFLLGEFNSYGPWSTCNFSFFKGLPNSILFF